MTTPSAAETAAAKAVASRPNTGPLHESDYHAQWQQFIPATLSDRLVAAMAGGRLADRLAWVFVAGYQSACRAAFPEIATTGWVAFAATEDRSPDNPLPGVTIVAKGNGTQLYGSKTWVAAVDHIEQLVVKSGRGPEAAYWLVDRGAPEVTFDRRPAPSFLGALSQGRAHFAGTPTAALKVLDDRHVGLFQWYETLFIYAAFCGLVQARTVEDDLLICSRDCIDGIEPALAALDQGSLDIAMLQKADARAQDLLVRLSGNRLQLAGHWEEDQRLIAMYSKAVRRLA